MPTASAEQLREQSAHRSGRVLGEIALAVRQRRAEVADDDDDERRSSPAASGTRRRRHGAIGTARDDPASTRQRRADGDDDTKPLGAIRTSSRRSRRCRRAAGRRRRRRAPTAHRARAADPAPYERGTTVGGVRSQRAGLGFAARAPPGAQLQAPREEQQDDGEVNEQRMEAAEKERQLVHASRSFTTWPWTSVSR